MLSIDFHFGWEGGAFLVEVQGGHLTWEIKKWKCKAM